MKSVRKQLAGTQFLLVLKISMEGLEDLSLEEGTPT